MISYVLCIFSLWNFISIFKIIFFFQPANFQLTNMHQNSENFNCLINDQVNILLHILIDYNF